MSQPYVAPPPADHPGATTSLVLGLIGLGALVLTLICCVTLPLVVCAPIAWVVGARAVRAIDARPGVYGNRSSAHAGMIMGIIGSVLGLLLVAVIAVVVIWVGVTGFSLV